jgi:uncharacterized protein with beta-barrel porin domain
VSASGFAARLSRCLNRRNAAIFARERRRRSSLRARSAQPCDTEPTRRCNPFGALLLSSAFLALVPAASPAQELVVNGGFETGCSFGHLPCSPWSFGGTAFVTGFGAQHAGSLAVTVSTGNNSGSLSQSVALAKSGFYGFSFWQTPINFGGPGTIRATATIGGQTVFNQVLPGGNGSTNYQNFSTQVRLTAGAADITFASAQATGGSTTWVVDDVSLIFLRALSIASLLPTGAPQNQQNVASGLDAFGISGGTLPAGFQTLFNLTPQQLVTALSQLSGEGATGAQTGAFQMMNSFLALMLDPSIDGRNGGGPAIGFAPERPELPSDVALAYASVLKAPAAPAGQPWSMWGSTYGGANHTTGDPVVAGSHDLSARAWGFAAGLDYRLSPDTKVGFALAGGGTNWGLSDGLGGGNSDALQAGVYALTRSGPAYLSGGLAYASHWMSTDRFALAGDHLTANFNGYSLAGRVESGYRVATPVIGITPYAAVQAQSFHTPSYSETDLTGGGFGLAFNAHTASDTRSELGTRLDRQIALDNGAVLALRGRMAWAHDWVSDPSLTAVFQTLPGASFVVDGATPAHNSALASAGAEIRLRSGWSAMAKFDGEFASGSQTYTGTGRVRYQW